MHILGFMMYTPINHMTMSWADPQDEQVAGFGSIRYWPVYLGKKKLSCLLLGPLAVHPICQGEGIGTKLVFKTLNLAEQYGWERIILVGDESYYSRFGFKKELAKDLIFPKPVNQDRLLGLELRPESLKRANGLVSKFE